MLQNQIENKKSMEIVEQIKTEMRKKVVTKKFRQNSNYENDNHFA